ncbi:MAG: Na/Pi cotransporter family protein [Calditrichaeota bacterium]|nr:MAG: Na/Pi cotransporter family protein [Calditrichota bacterium]MBL1206577.1 Na/Pi cotransporter family protein [Calditrichota bacterium]NOG46404.1 Na/Pi symporter [Calditrichota bacterium]
MSKYFLTILVFISFPFHSIYGQQYSDGDSTFLRIVKPTSVDQPNFSGDGRHQTINEKTKQPIRVQVLDSKNTPVSNVSVHFLFIKGPAKQKGALLETEVIQTDEKGIAENYITLGNKSGIYEFSARIYNAAPNNDIVYFRIHGRESKWVFFLVIGLLGGLALFLFGMEMMSEGMKKSAGSNLRSILSTLTNNRFIAVGVGTFVTMIIQSSSATTVMLVSFVQAQLMTFGQSLGIILGADIGTTITAQLIAFKLTDYALLMIGVGFLIFFFGKSQKYKNIGETILGFGMLFFGMKIMSDAMYPLRTYIPFIDLLLTLENPLLGLLVGTVFTALIQSSSAFTGIIIILGTQGLITLEAGIPLLFGANIGTSITAFLASINTSREAKRVAIAHTLFKAVGVLLFIWWIPSFAELIRWISPKGTASITGMEHLAEVVPRQIANAHTVFNVSLTFVMLPFTNIAANWICKIFPDLEDEEEESPFKVKFLDEGLIDTPALALNLAKVEILRLGKKVSSMVEKIIKPFIKPDFETLEEVDFNEQEVNFISSKVTRYLTKISQQDLEEERVNEVFQMMHAASDLEQIGDIVSKDLKRLAQKKMDLNCDFSEQGKSEVIDFHTKTMKQISRTLNVFKDVNLEQAKKVEKKYKQYRLMEMDLRRIHYTRLQQDVPETVASSEIHVTLIDLLKRISSHATNVARTLLNTDLVGKNEKNKN